MFTPITSRKQLLEYFEEGGKPSAQCRVGLEYEMFLFDAATLKRAPYEGEQGMRSILEKFQTYGWELQREHEQPIALEREGATISLEPGGQIELSGAPHLSLHDVAQEAQGYKSALNAICKELNLFAWGLGYDPKWSRADMQWMPKDRYKIMRDYMPLKGNLGLDMMTATATVQANLDYTSEADMAKKFRVSMALQPLVTALFANSPLSSGQVNGYESYRSHVWENTDPDRCGLLPFAFEPAMRFERYVNYALQVPLYFLIRNGDYIPMAGKSFEDFMQGRLPGYAGQYSTMEDWALHLSTLFPEVRLKQYLEMRGADSGSLEHSLALAALWVGLLYDEETLDESFNFISDWTYEECVRLRAGVPRSGLNASFRGVPLRDIAWTVMHMAEQGLIRRGLKNEKGQDESLYLDYLRVILERNQSSATLLRRKFEEVYQGNMDAFMLSVIRFQ